MPALLTFDRCGITTPYMRVNQYTLQGTCIYMYIISLNHCPSSSLVFQKKNFPFQKPYFFFVLLSLLPPTFSETLGLNELLSSDSSFPS